MKNIFGEEMEYRPCISAVVDALYNDFSLSPTPEMKKSKIETWHLALEEITDKGIAEGYRRVATDKFKFIPASGIFRDLCVVPPKLELFKHEEIENKQTPEEIEGIKKARNRFFEKMKEIL